jgi:hypothetical protein
MNHATEIHDTCFGSGAWLGRAAHRRLDCAWISVADAHGSAHAEDV